MAYEEYYRAREFMVHYLERDLMGPYSENEELLDDPTVAYICGVLYPRRLQRSRETSTRKINELTTDDYASPVLPEGDNVGLEVDGDDETAFDVPIALANTKNPSSMAMTFQVDAIIAKKIMVTVNAAKYLEINARNDPSMQQYSFVDNEVQENGNSGSSVWSRIPIGPVEFEIDLESMGNRELEPINIYEGLQFFCRTRSINNGSVGSAPLIKILTVGLTNILEAEYEETGAKSFFQPRIEIRASGDQSDIFVERPAPVHLIDDPEYQSSRLLYKHSKSFAVGHGCAVSWTANQDGSRAVTINTAVIPKKDVRLTDSDPKVNYEALGLYFLASSPKELVISGLRDFLTGYSSWISERRADLSKITDSAFHQRGDAHLNETESAESRINAGIDLLANDQKVWEAFRFANRAMLSTRARTDWLILADSVRPETPDETSPGIRWRPFQLGFILLCIGGINDESDGSDRSLVDLLWFPTGGGKTEAYLGLVAFTIFLRRLKHGNSGAGVTVLMRYTMRLLTIQQFQRAALLICACERIRIENANLGNSSISIGLYVGSAATPNAHVSRPRFGMIGTIEALSAASMGNNLEGATPVQFTRCPWCGTAMDHKNYSVESVGAGFKLNEQKLFIRCSNPDCSFSPSGSAGELPIFLVDEDIYRHRPSFVIATVDKFANLPWRAEDVGNLFNIYDQNPPPELIIQDELHLISGPLGTLTGLYESAIERLCRDVDGLHSGPKIIASTATIKRAESQCKTIFDKSVFQFPPQGLDSRDSYFSVEMPPEDRGSRQYVGLFAPGTSSTTLLVRTYAALLQGAKEMESLEGLDTKVLDAYWTMVGYFNARRLLGSALLQVEDDVSDRIGLLASRAGANARDSLLHLELSGRVNARDIIGLLDTLEKPKNDEACIDVILSTNMISVGVDINRLGLMAVLGQPGNWSEYVQATSRVGRQYPGLVVVMLNAFKSRDRSHYESFESNHGAIYQHVEGTTATPFSPRARDKGLHAVVIGLARILISELRDNKDARRIAEYRSKVEEAVSGVLLRAKRVSRDDGDPTGRQISEILDVWVERARENPELEYSARKAVNTLLLPAGEERRRDAIRGPDKDGILMTMQSLRNVDTESKLFFTPGTA